MVLQGAGRLTQNLKSQQRFEIAVSNNMLATWMSLSFQPGVSPQSFICSQKSRQHTCDTQVGRRIPGLRSIAKDGVPVPSRQNLPLLVCRRKDRGVQRFVQNCYWRVLMLFFQEFKEGEHEYLAP